MSILTGDSVSYRTRPAEQLRVTDRLTRAAARSRVSVRAAVQAAYAYDAARSAIARRRVLEQFQAQLGR
jgi:hypothetical protein